MGRVYELPAVHVIICEGSRYGRNTLNLHLTGRSRLIFKFYHTAAPAVILKLCQRVNRTTAYDILPVYFSCEFQTQFYASYISGSTVSYISGTVSVNSGCSNTYRA